MRPRGLRYTCENLKSEARTEMRPYVSSTNQIDSHLGDLITPSSLITQTRSGTGRHEPMRENMTWQPPWPWPLTMPLIFPWQTPQWIGPTLQQTCKEHEMKDSTKCSTKELEPVPLRQDTENCQASSSSSSVHPCFKLVDPVRNIYSL